MTRSSVVTRAVIRRTRVSVRFSGAEAELDSLFVGVESGLVDDSEEPPREDLLPLTASHLPDR